MSKNKYLSALGLAATFFVVSPLDDILFSSMFGTMLFGFGTIEFYCFLALMTTLSVFLWIRHRKKQSSNRSNVKSSKGKFGLLSYFRKQAPCLKKTCISLFLTPFFKPLIDNTNWFLLRRKISGPFVVFLLIPVQKGSYE